MALPHLRKTARSGSRQGLHELGGPSSSCTLERDHQFCLPIHYSVWDCNPCCTHAKGTHDWIEWIVMENHPSSFFDVVRAELKDKVAEKRHGLIFDGWLENGYHFVGTFVVMQPDDPSDTTQREMYLLSFKPHKTRHFGADATIDLLDDLLDMYAIEASQLCFLVGDNASVNVSIGKKVNVPLVSCASHHLHLAAEKHLQPYTELFDKLAPHLDDSDEYLAPLLLSAEDKNRLRTLLKDLKKFESVSKKLQQEQGLTLRHVRVLFDELLAEFPDSCVRHLASNARIVAFQASRTAPSRV
ncbi:hypothetical protein F441_06851 [Phytophthora nicotianae CJ01A1]|uniref:Uncharacterized protein n=1 Tax=Phytophthora nicotianae CJ01A1 TaxID=1317063 RepID=W2X8Z9_PHYNI|nr:hypothetical protein F441_06851 [Phytophthora nicotianae CJ01A1]